MALTPAKMKHVDMVVLEQDRRRVTAALGRLGVLHLVEVKPEETGARLIRSDRNEDLDRCRSLNMRLSALRDRLGLQTLPEAAHDEHESISVIEKEIADIEKLVVPLIEQRTTIETESEEIQDELLRISSLGMFSVPVARIVQSPFLHFAIGLIRPSDLEAVAEEARDDVLLLDTPGPGNRRHLIAVTRRPGRFALETLLKQHNFIRQDISELSKGVPAEIIAGLEKRLGEIRENHKRITNGLRRIADEHGARIASMVYRLELEASLLEASANFGHTESTCLISGWLPADYVSVASTRLLEISEGRIVVNVREPEDVGAEPEDVPVLMKNPAVIRPFEMLVRGFGWPGYGEIEPTILVALSFLAMYGLMFGDVGHGLVLAAIGVIMRWRARNDTMRDLGYIVAAAGVTSILTGMLYGSFFGKEDLAWLPALWMHPMHDVMRVLQIPVIIGFALISLGVILNIVNHFRKGHYLEAIIDRFGVVGIVLYWGAVGIGVRYVMLDHEAPSTLAVVLLIVVPLVILFFREPILALLSRRHRGGESEGVFVTVMHGGIGLMETVSMYLANTVSFTRVGAFALAHAGLCIAVFSMQDMVRSLPAGPVLGMLILILGNALVIVLEGLIVFVQCLRLEYYEFLGKFFQGTGKKYSPFRVR